MAHEVFISYSTRDKVVADAICHVLENLSIRCWIAPRDILSGKDWSEALVEAIESSRIMLLLFSGSANASEQIIREVNCAVSSGIIILPLRLEDIPMSKSLQYYIGTPHWLDLLTPPLENHFEHLVKTVRLLLDSSRGLELPLRIQHLMAQAEEGDKEAMVNLGYAYTMGNEVAVDYRISTSWFRKAARAGHPMGMNNYGFALREGHGVEVDYKEALYWLEKAAALSNAKAINNLGDMYRLGIGVQRDLVKAIQLFRQAMALGEPLANANLGYLYIMGEGLTRDFQLAFDLFQKGARMGDPACMYNLGTMFENGQAVERDEIQAVEWYRRAAGKNYRLARERLTALGYSQP